MAKIRLHQRGRSLAVPLRQFVLDHHPKHAESPARAAALSFHSRSAGVKPKRLPVTFGGHFAPEAAV